MANLLRGTIVCNAQRPLARACTWSSVKPSLVRLSGEAGWAMPDSRRPQPASLRGGGGARRVECQANPRRVARVTKQIEREVASLMVSDDVLLRVTRNRDTNSSLCSCSGVEVSNDLQVVKIYMSIMSADPEMKDQVMGQLKGLTGYVRRHIGDQVRLRLTPEVRFIHDVAVERGERVLALLDNMEKERERGEGVGGAEAGAAEDAEDEEEGLFAEEDGVVAAAVKGGGSSNPFLEGVGDEEYDSDVGQDPGEQRFFTADMFPDALPEIDRLEAGKKDSKWQASRAKKRGTRLKKQATKKR